MSNMVVNTNVLALNSHRNLGKVGKNQATASQRLSSGMRVNSAADDAAGLAISEKMRAQIRGLDQASKNAQDAQSLVQTAEGGLQEIDNMVQRIRELVVQASNDTNDQKAGDANGDRQKIQDEINALVEEIDSMSERVEFNNKTLLNGDFADGKSTLHFQIGANADQSIKLNIEEMTTAKLFDGKTIDVLKETGGEIGGVETAADNILNTLDDALSMITSQRSKLGAVENRLEYTQNSLDISSENLSAAESRIRDTDMAKEMMSLTQSNVLQQAATSMLAQANQAPQSVLQLLQ